MPTADNTLWIGTEESGLVRYHNGEFQTFTTADGLPSNRVLEIQKDAGNNLLISTDGGTARWRDGRFTTEREEIYSNFKIHLAPSGNRWEMDKNGLRLTAGDGRETRFDLPFDAAEISPDRTLNYFILVKMFEDRDGALWISAAGKLFKLKDGAITMFDAKDGMPPSLVRVIAQDRDGVIWIGTEEQGACRLNANRFDCFGTADGLSSDKIIDIFTDREGTLWLGTNERGFNRVTNRTVTPLSTAEGLADKNVYPILEDKTGGVWLGSFSALSYFKDGKIKNYTRKDGLLYEVVESFYEDADGRLWIGSVGGVEYLENGKFYDFTEKLNAKSGDFDFRDIHRDRDGAFWFGTNKGLIKYENGSATRFTTADGLPGDDVKIIHETRDGTLLIGTYGGLAVLSSKFRRQTPDNQENRLKAGLRTFTEQDGLAGNRIRSIYEDEDGTMWVGTYDSGLSRFKDNKFTNYTTENGLFSNGVFQILPDECGNFWMSSNQGIYRVSRQQLNDFADGKITRIVSSVFGKSDGMLNTECNGGRSPAGIKTRDGRLWFPTQDGAAIINPESVLSNPLAPPVVIESVLIDNHPTEIRQSAVEIQPGQNNLEIHYTGLSFIKPEQMQFRYKLEGLDENWTDAANRREAYFPYLPPGKYTFRVIAANSDNVWNEQGAAITIVVKPAFYQTWWFLILSAVAIGLLAFWLYQRRLNEIRRRQLAQEDFSRRLINAHETERRRIAAGLHDSLGQQLLVIKNWAALELNVLPPENSSREALGEISATASQAVEEVREIIYDLRPYQLDKIGLKNTIWFMIEKIAAASGIEFQTDIGEINDLFAPEAEIALYRVVQECVNNIVKHSGATRAAVLIERKEKSVKLTIEDDGRGFNADDENGRGKGFGLEGLAERVRILGGTLSIQSAPENGTKIQIEIFNENQKVANN